MRGRGESFHPRVMQGARRAVHTHQTNATYKRARDAQHTADPRASGRSRRALFRNILLSAERAKGPIEGKDALTSTSAPNPTTTWIGWRAHLLLPHPRLSFLAFNY